jgi:hypothetical protein
VKVYRIRIVPERAPEVSRVFDVSARQALDDVHFALQAAFELDNDHMYAFYMSGRHFDKSSELAGPDSRGGGSRAERTRLVELGLEPGKSFSYVFDFGDELWHTLEVESVRDVAAPPEEPQLVESVGEAPPQHLNSRDWDDRLTPDVSELVPLADEFVRLMTHGGDERDPSTEELQAAHRAAMDLAAKLERDDERFWALEETTEHDLVHFMLDLPFELARAGMADKGAELALAMSFVDPGDFLTDRAMILAEAGEREAALAQVAENIASMPTDQWVQIKAGDVYVELGEVGPAETAYRAALELDGPVFERDEAVERLLELFTTQGREADATALKVAEQARTDEAARIKREPPSHASDVPSDTVVRFAPKVGRNDPCPCGSGKKYKKCCGE